jgi:hypothetical protein
MVPTELSGFCHPFTYSRLWLTTPTLYDLLCFPSFQTWLTPTLKMETVINLHC